MLEHLFYDSGSKKHVAGTSALTRPHRAFDLELQHLQGNTNMLSHADPPPYGHHHGCLGIRTPDHNGTKCF